MALLGFSLAANAQNRANLRNASRTTPPVQNAGAQQNAQVQDGRLGPDNGPANLPPSDTSQTPLILETYIFPDSVIRRKIFTWTTDRYFNAPSVMPLDTGMNDRRTEYPFYQKDVGVTYLGTSGSPLILHDYFKRQQNDRFYYISPYLEYLITPDNLEYFNSKVPYTRFEYFGTLFGNRVREESNVKVTVSANIKPAWTATLKYQRYGSRGMMLNEGKDARSFTLYTAYTGKRYSAHAGYIYNRVNNNENGGMTNDSYILDTTVDARAIPISLSSAKTNIAGNTFFLTHSYGIPIRFSSQDVSDAGEGTMMLLGHSMEYSTFKRSYTDNIALYDSVGRSYYNNQFYINSTESIDSMRNKLFDNRFFLRIQPWSPTAIISKLNGGIGYSYINNYAFAPENYLRPTGNDVHNNIYMYAGASGLLQRYFSWDAFLRYELTGYYAGDIAGNGNIRISAYPIRGGVHLLGNIQILSKRPDYFLNNTYSNHSIWKNNFDNVTETKLQATLSIPDWNFEAAFRHALISNPVYFGLDAKPTQSGGTVNILSGYIMKNFQAWHFHFDNRILLQFSSDNDIIPLPTVSANLTYYFQIEAVKNVLTLQLGADTHFNTAYYAYGYNPSAGMFHIQNDRKIGDYPYVDAFVNMQWKHATLFAKVVNVSEGWLNADYFSALHYIRSQRVFKVGISWVFL